MDTSPISAASMSDAANVLLSMTSDAFKAFSSGSPIRNISITATTTMVLSQTSSPDPAAASSSAASAAAPMPTVQSDRDKEFKLISFQTDGRTSKFNFLVIYKHPRTLDGQLHSNPIQITFQLSEVVFKYLIDKINTEKPANLAIYKKLINREIKVFLVRAIDGRDLELENHETLALYTLPPLQYEIHDRSLPIALSRDLVLYVKRDGLDISSNHGECRLKLKIAIGEHVCFSDPVIIQSKKNSKKPEPRLKRSRIF